MVAKKEIRRVLSGSCVVVPPPGEGSSAAAAPRKVTVSIRRRRGCCGWLAGPWKALASFTFSDQTTTSTNAFLDMERVFRYTRKADAGAAQVKICVKERSGVTRVGRVSLVDFMGHLLQSGSPESFVLYVHEGKVELGQAPTPMPRTDKEESGRGDEDPHIESEETENEADNELSEEETETDKDSAGSGSPSSADEANDDSDGSGSVTSADEADEDSAREGPGNEHGRVRLFLGWLGCTLRHHSRSLVVAAEVALILGTLKVWGPPAYMANWWWGGAGGEL